MSDKAEIIQVPKKHGRRWLSFALAVLLVAVLLALFLLDQSTELDGIKRFFCYLGADGAAFPVENGICAVTDDCLAAASGDAVSFYDADGTVCARAEIAGGEDLALKSRGDFLLAYEIGGPELILLDSAGEERCTAAVTAVYDADLAKNGSFAVLSAGDGCRAVLEVYSPSGELRFRHSSATRDLCACAISPDGSFVSAVALGQEELELSASALLFATDSAEPVGELPLGAQLVYDLAFLEDDRLCAVGETSLAFFTSEGTLLRKYPENEGDLCAYSFGDGFLAAVYDLYDREDCGLMLLDTDGKSAGFCRVAAPLSLQTCGSYTALLTADSLSIYDRSLRTCAETERGGFLAAYVRSDGTAFCLDGSQATLFIP